MLETLNLMVINLCYMRVDLIKTIHVKQELNLVQNMRDPNISLH
jgi:hypothetical protein